MRKRIWNNWFFESKLKIWGTKTMLYQELVLIQMNLHWGGKLLLKFQPYIMSNCWVSLSQTFISEESKESLLVSII